MRATDDIHQCTWAESAECQMRVRAESESGKRKEEAKREQAKVNDTTCEKQNGHHLNVASRSRVLGFDELCVVKRRGMDEGYGCCNA